MGYRRYWGKRGAKHYIKPNHARKKEGANPLSGLSRHICVSRVRLCAATVNAC